VKQVSFSKQIQFVKAYNGQQKPNLRREKEGLVVLLEIVSLKRQ